MSEQSSHSPTVICLGRSLIDIIVRPADALPPRGEALLVNDTNIIPGGSAVRSAIALSELGVTSAVAAGIGNDLIGFRLSQLLSEQNIGLVIPLQPATENTSFCLVIVNGRGESRYLYNLGADTRIAQWFAVDENRAQLVHAPSLRHIHVGGLNLLGDLDGAALHELFRYIKQNRPGVTISADTSKVPDKGFRNKQGLSYLDILFCTGEEAYAMTQRTTIPDLLAALVHCGSKVVILKLGAAGAVVARADCLDAPRIVQAFDVTERIYSDVGAGDIFAAVFLKKFLAGPDQDISSVAPDVLAQWCDEATDYATEFICRSRLGPIGTLHRFTQTEISLLCTRTDTNIDSRILPIHFFFEHSGYNRSALEDATIPTNCQASIVDYLIAEVPTIKTVVELCCGGSWLPIRLSWRLQESTFQLCDRYRNQVNIARQNVSQYSPTNTARFRYLETDALDCGINAGWADLVMISFALHLFDSSNKQQMLRESHRILKPGGILAVLTFLPEDIVRTLFHRYITGFRDIDLKRYADSLDIEECALRAGLELQKTKKFCYAREFTNVTSFMSHVRKEPFSTFSLLRQQVGSREFDSRLAKCEQDLVAEFESRPVTNSSEVILFLFQKPNC